jgi:hypothetical protein
MITIAQGEQYRKSVEMLQSLPRHEQSRVIAQMISEGSLTYEQGKDILLLLDPSETETSDPR